MFIPHIFVWGFCFCSLTPGSLLPPPPSPPPSTSTHLTHLIGHNSSHTTHLTQLILHNSSATTSLTLLHLRNSSPTTHLCVAGAALGAPDAAFAWQVQHLESLGAACGQRSPPGSRAFLRGRCGTRCTGCWSSWSTRHYGRNEPARGVYPY